MTGRLLYRAPTPHYCWPPLDTHTTTLPGWPGEAAVTAEVREPPPTGSVWLCGCGDGWVVRRTPPPRGGYSPAGREWTRAGRFRSWRLRRAFPTAGDR